MKWIRLQLVLLCAMCASLLIQPTAAQTQAPVARGKWHKMTVVPSGSTEGYRVQTGLVTEDSCTILVRSQNELVVQIRNGSKDRGGEQGRLEEFVVKNTAGQSYKMPSDWYRYQRPRAGQETRTPLNGPVGHSTLGDFRWRFEDAALPLAARQLLAALPWWLEIDASDPNEKAWVMNLGEYQYCLVIVGQAKASFTVHTMGGSETARFSQEDGKTKFVEHTGALHDFPKGSTPTKGGPNAFWQYEKYFAELPAEIQPWISALRAANQAGHLGKKQ